jgi:hypothetical protein
MPKFKNESDADKVFSLAQIVVMMERPHAVGYDRWELWPISRLYIGTDIRFREEDHGHAKEMGAVSRVANARAGGLSSHEGGGTTVLPESPSGPG